VKEEDEFEWRRCGGTYKTERGRKRWGLLHYIYGWTIGSDPSQSELPDNRHKTAFAFSKYHLPFTYFWIHSHPFLQTLW